MLTVHLGNTPAADRPNARGFEDLPNCLIRGVEAALPVFLQAFLGCLTGGGGETNHYQPGNRTRC